MTPFFLVYFRYGRIGREHGRVKGGLIVAANHRSFLDPFLIGGVLPWRRPMNYVAKVELFEPAAGLADLAARRLPDPPRRSPTRLSMETARLVVERGGTVCIFPEGTRIRSGSLADAEARRRPARARDRRPGPADRGLSAPSTSAAAGGSARARSGCGSAAR